MDVSEGNQPQVVAGCEDPATAGLRRRLYRLAAALAQHLTCWWSQRLFPTADNGPASPDRRSWLALAAVALVAGAILLPNLSFPLLDPDEGRYAEIGREMAASGDWIVPTIHGQPYYDKPPLLYWLIAGSYELLGVSEASARLAPALASWLTVLGVFLFGRRVSGNRTGLTCAAALLLMPGFVTVARLLIIDGLLTCCVCWSLLAGHAALVPAPGRWRWWLLCSVACALGVLAKGPVAVVLVVPPLGLYAWLNRDRVQIRTAEVFACAGLTALLAVPWFVAMTAREPAFAQHFLVDQHLVRFFKKEYHVEPIWFYVPVLLVGCLPWPFLLIPLGRFLTSRAAAVQALRSQGLGLFLLWAGWCVFFFSMSSGKLPPYVLPALPAIALLAGSFMEQVLWGGLTDALFRQARSVAPWMATAVLALNLAVISVGACVWLQLIGPVTAGIQAGVAGLCLLFVLGWGHRLTGRTAWALSGVLALSTVLVSAHEIGPSWARHRGALVQSPEALALLRDQDVGIVCSGSEWGSVPFYAGRTRNVISWSEQTPEQVRDLIQGCGRVVLVVRQKEDVERCRVLFAADRRFRTLAAVGDIQVMIVE